MAIQNNDLFVVQSQTDSKLYKLKLEDLITEVEAGGGVIFKGSVDLNNPPSAQTPDAITLPANNGDLYIVESDAGIIDAGWVMQNGETSAQEGDRIVYDLDNSNWILITTNNSSTGTVTGITATLPLKSDGDQVTPVISIRQARTTTAAGSAGDGEGPAGAVAKLAEESDVIASTGTGDATAVVTADLLKDTNDAVAALVAGGGSTTISEGGTDIISGALQITTNPGNAVEIGVNKETFCPYDFASLSDIP